MTAPAVIIPWRDDGSQSLRYMLRGLENLSHSEVVIAGDRVPWLKGLTNLETPRGDRYARRHDSVFSDSQQSRLVAAAHLGKGYAYLMDDDMFVVEPIDWVAPVHRGAMPTRSGSYWYEAGFLTAQWLRRIGSETLRNFEVHTPLLVDVEALLEVADMAAASNLPAVWLRSAYGNLIVGRHAGAVVDPKVSAKGTRPHPSWPIWSTSDTAFHGGIAGKQIRRLFHRPSPWEV